MGELRIKTEFEQLIPPLSTEEFEELRQSINTYGCRDPIVVWNDYIIDGHNRMKVCQEFGLPFNTFDMTFDFDTEDEVKEWIIRNQFGRRNISAYQRSKLALQLKTIIAGKAKENQLGGLKQHADNAIQNNSNKRGDKNSTVSMNSSKRTEPAPEQASQGVGKSSKSVNTREELAKIAGVSEQTISRVETIEREAPEAIKQAAQNGDISINRAYEITKQMGHGVIDEKAEADYKKFRDMERLLENVSRFTFGMPDMMNYRKYHHNHGKDLPELCDQCIRIFEKMNTFYEMDIAHEEGRG